MWSIIERVLPVLIIIMLITQVVIPIIFPAKLKMFWIFRKDPDSETSKKSYIAPEELKTELDSVKVSVTEVKEKVKSVKSKVEENLKAAEVLKKDTENLI